MTVPNKFRYKTDEELESTFDKRPKFIIRFNDDNQKERVHKAAKDKNLSINKMMIEALERYLN